jgi:hypothetical protein
MTIISPDAEVFNFSRGECIGNTDLTLKVGHKGYTNPPDEEFRQRNTGKVLKASFMRPYGTGHTVIDLDMPIQTTVEALMADPEAAAVVRRAVMEELLGLLEQS